MESYLLARRRQFDSNSDNVELLRDETRDVGCDESNKVAVLPASFCSSDGRAKHKKEHLTRYVGEYCDWKLMVKTYVKLRKIT
jgi:hypothetical protein